ncbi:MAG: response regulator transcription factor [Bacteroidales bacterium]|nr:MAG: response regulator transcription factor [Bacteroidales bacterium]
MGDARSKILLVDDEPDILEFLSYNLKMEGYQIYVADNGAAAIKTAKKVNPHLILLDIMMPEMDGIETCKQLRKIPGLNYTIIAFLTARGEDYSQIAGFEAGGDDYINKPVKPMVLLSRIKALLKRYNDPIYAKFRDDSKKIIKKGELKIDTEKFVVYKKNKELLLTKKEFELLLFLSSKPGKVFTRKEIFCLVWGDDVIVGDRTIDVHIRKLREKIGDKHIKTLKGVGYKFKE